MYPKMELAPQPWSELREEAPARLKRLVTTKKITPIHAAEIVRQNFTTKRFNDLIDFILNMSDETYTLRWFMSQRSGAKTGLRLIRAAAENPRQSLHGLWDDKVVNTFIEASVLINVPANKFKKYNKRAERLSKYYGKIDQEILLAALELGLTNLEEKKKAHDKHTRKRETVST